MSDPAPSTSTRAPGPKNPGLDLQKLRALRSGGASSEGGHLEMVDRLGEHLDSHDGYVAFSGGKDSLVALHLALQADPSVPVVFFDSGFEFPETYRYLRTVQDHFGIDVDMIQIPTSALQLMHAGGLWDHTAPLGEYRSAALRSATITEPARRAHSSHGPGEVWGVRAQESRGRRIAYAIALRQELARNCRGCCEDPRQAKARHGGVIRRADHTVALGPIWNWRTERVWGHIARHHLPVNPVYAKLRSIGAPEQALRVTAILDGQRLEEGRATWLRRGWPDLFDDLAQLLPRLREYV